MPVEQINVTLGTAGHIDHGKTTLVKNLTGCDTDRLKEEKERGMSIELGFAPCRIANLQVGIVDVPGHENFIKTMVAGATGVDAVILVVAADDGIMPQTREHLDILTLLGIRYGMVALTKVDRVSPEQVLVVQENLRNFLNGTFLADAPILPVSNITGQGYDLFLDALAKLVHSIRPRRADGVFRMPVERAFTVKGYGTVVAGIPVSGSAKIDDEIVLLPQNRQGRVKAIQVFKLTSQTVLAGQCTALNIKQLEAKEIQRGDVIATPGYFQPFEWFLGKLRLLGGKEVFLKNGMALRFHTGTSEVQASVYLMEANRAVAGEECFIQVRTRQPLVAGPGDPFILRTLSPVQTIGGGKIIEGQLRRLKRNQPGLKEELEEWINAIGDEKSFVEYALISAPDLAVGEKEIAVRTKIPLPRACRIIGQLVQEGRVLSLGGDLYLHREAARKGRELVLQGIREFHAASPESPGITVDQLLETVRLKRPVLDELTGLLKKEGLVADRNSRLALADHREVINDQDRLILEKIETLFRDRPFNPPEISEVLAAVGLSAQKFDKFLKVLFEHNRLIRVPEGLVFHRQAVDRARELLVSFIQKEGKLESVKFKYLLDTTRKYALPLLDYFDRIGVTYQKNYTRYLKPTSKNT